MSDKPEALTEGELWRLFRSIMSQGAVIQQDYQAGTHATYEHYSARLDAAAAERQIGFWAVHIEPLHAECERLAAEVCRVAEVGRSQIRRIEAKCERLRADLIECRSSVKDDLAHWERLAMRNENNESLHAIGNHEARRLFALLARIDAARKGEA